MNLVNGALYNTGTNSNTDGTIEDNSYVEPVPETKFNVTVNQGDHGTVTVNGSAFTSGNTVQVGAYTHATVQATPASGYRFTGWTKTDGVAYAENTGSTTNPVIISASDTGSLTANYEPVPATTVYVAKGTNVKYIYAWYNDGSNHDITAAFPGQQIENTTTYNFGGIAYYKYTFNRDISTFNFIISDGTSSHQSSDATGYAAGGTYYVQWSGGKNTAVSDMTTGSTYPNYILRYQPTSENPDTGTWTSVQFTDSAATISNLAQGSYRFFIVRQDKNNEIGRAHV